MKKITNAARLAAILCLPLLSLAQQNTFKVTFGGFANDAGHDVIEMNDGNLLITGATGSFGDTTYDGYLIKTSASGELIWEHLFGGPFEDGGNEIVTTPDGNYFIAGHTESYGLGDCDGYYLLFNAQGDSLWNRTYGTPEDDAAYGCDIAPDGNYMSAGITESASQDADGYVIKHNSSGDILWSELYGGAGDDYLAAVRSIGDGSFLAAGKININGNDDFWVMKLDENGDELWNKSFGTSDNELLYGFRLAADGGAMLTGKSVNPQTFTSSAYIVRVDAEGNILWSHSFGIGQGNGANCTIQTTDGNWMICGALQNAEHNSPDAFLMQMTDDGIVLWTKFFGGDSDDSAGGLSLCNNGDIVMTGYTMSEGEGMRDLLLIRTSSEGEIVSGLENEFTSYNSVSVIPNPFNESTRIIIPEAYTNASFSLFDVRGKAIVVQNHITGQEIILQKGNLSAGIYFYSLTSKGMKEKLGKIVVE